MRKSLLIAAVVFSMASVKTHAQDTKIRFFGQPEINYSSTREKNHFDGVSPTGQYIKKDTTYSQTNSTQAISSFL